MRTFIPSFVRKVVVAIVDVNAKPDGDSNGNRGKNS